MPTYVYECSTCNRVFEVDQRITDDPLTSCECGGQGTVKRLIQPTAIVFKGAGFHINDYAPNKGRSEEPASCPAKGGDGPGCEACAGPSDA
ncbi:MAG: FmdB family zinc ribbon protein [Fimbriimonadales bacterium]